MKLQVSVTMFTPLLLTLIFLSQSPSVAAEPDWYPYVFARGSDRVCIQNMPMHKRPYRPMHFYGNTIRRSYHRGYSAPLPRDIAQGARTLLRDRLGEDRFGPIRRR